MNNLRTELPFIKHEFSISKASNITNVALGSEESLLFL